MIALLAAFLIATPVASAEEVTATDEFSFIAEGEKNREKAEAQRAPAASIFLQEEEEEEDITWDAPTNDTADIMDEEIEAIEPATSMMAVPSFESDDPEEDMEDFGPSVSGKEPLGDYFQLRVFEDGLGGVAAELPVLVARHGGDLDGQLWVVADIYADGAKVGESRHLVTPESLIENGPTYVWIKSNIPVNGPNVVAEMRLFASQPGKKEMPLFQRSAQLGL